jgi:hypothetical protein
MTAWTDPITFTLDQMVTPTHMNTYLRDNTLALMHPVGSREFSEAGPVGVIAETSLYNSQPTITGGSLGTSGTFLACIYGRHRQGFTTGLLYTWRVYLGATLVLTYAATGGGAVEAEGQFWLEFRVEALGAANSQAICVHGGTNVIRPQIPRVAYSTSSVDLSVDRAFNVTVQMPTTHATDYTVKQFSSQLVGKN